MRGGIKIRTEEILTGTKTFQKAKTCIYNTVECAFMWIFRPNMEKTWLKDLVTGNASFFDLVAVRRLNKIKTKKTTQNQLCKI